MWVCVCGIIIKAISDYALPVDLLQARAEVVSRACEVDWPRKPISESNFLYRFSSLL